MSEANPYAAPGAALDADDATTRDWPGLRRLPYFGLLLLVQVVIGGMAGAIAGASGSAASGVALQGVAIIASMVVAAQRLRNIGNSGWWALLFIVPLVNIIIGLRCLAYPTGYAEHQTMDTTGKVVLGLCALVMIGIAAAVAIPFLQGANG